MVRIASATGVPCATSTSTWRSLDTISSGVCLFLPIVVILLRLRSHTSGWTTPTGADQESRGRRDSCQVSCFVYAAIRAGLLDGLAAQSATLLRHFGPPAFQPLGQL